MSKPCTADSSVLSSFLYPLHYCLCLNSCGSCPAGMSGDGTRSGCRPYSERCSSTSCFRGVRCTETATGVVCGSCPAGYKGNGRSCRDVNEVSRGQINVINVLFLEIK